MSIFRNKKKNIKVEQISGKIIEYLENNNVLIRGSDGCLYNRNINSISLNGKIK